VDGFDRTWTSRLWCAISDDEFLKQLGEMEDETGTTLTEEQRRKIDAEAKETVEREFAAIQASLQRGDTIMSMLPFSNSSIISQADAALRQVWANRKPDKATMIVIGLASRPDIQEHSQNSGKHRADVTIKNQQDVGHLFHVWLQPVKIIEEVRGREIYYAQEGITDQKHEETIGQLNEVLDEPGDAGWTEPATNRQSEG
jgi:hypothetical protein